MAQRDPGSPLSPQVIAAASEVGAGRLIVVSSWTSVLNALWQGDSRRFRFRVFSGLRETPSRWVPVVSRLLAGWNFPHRFEISSSDCSGSASRLCFLWRFAGQCSAQEECMNPRTSQILAILAVVLTFLPTARFVMHGRPTWLAVIARSIFLFPP